MEEEKKEEFHERTLELLVAIQASLEKLNEEVAQFHNSRWEIYRHERDSR
jgi:hypothetical protein